MLKHHFFISLVGTILLYISVGLLFFYLLNNYVGTEQKIEEKTVSFSLSQYIPEVTSPVEEPIKDEPVEPEPMEPEPVVEEEKVEQELPEPEPVEKEEKVEPIIEEVIPEPIVEKIIPKPSPIVKKKVKKVVKKEKPKKKAVKKKRVKKKTVKKRTVKRKPTARSTASKKKASPAKKNAFLSKIRSKINRNKTYPRIAQKRGMQGSVKVRFTISASGKVGNISVTGPKVFRSSARKAVKRAFPINAKNAPITLPKTMNVTLRYQIR